MIIMVFFLILSILLIVGTVVYIKKTNKKNIDTTTLKTGKHKKERNKSTKKQNKKKLSNILKIKIKDKIICLGNRYSIIVNLGSIDYNMLSLNEQEMVEDVLIQTALTIDYPIQFFSTTEYIDTSNIIKKIEGNKFDNENIRQYQYKLTEYLSNLMESNEISIVKNYAIISYDGLYKNAIIELDRKYTLLKNNLSRAKVSCVCLNENELYNLIYRELNKNSTLKIDNLIRGGDSLYVNKKKKEKRRRNKHF